MALNEGLVQIFVKNNNNNKLKLAKDRWENDVLIAYLGHRRKFWITVSELCKKLKETETKKEIVMK